MTNETSYLSMWVLNICIVESLMSKWTPCDVT